MLIKPGKPKVQSSKEKEEGKEQAEKQEAAEQAESEQAESEPIIHRPKGKSAFTVYTGYLEPQCESGSTEASLTQ